MSVRPLCCDPHPTLRAKAHRVASFTDALGALARDLVDTMYANDGIGLAAPQVGEGVAVFVANPSQERGREIVVVNPSMETTGGRAVIVEGCLSVPNVWARVRRAAHVRLRGQDTSGRPVELTADGLLAIVLQHEYDHLQGRLFIDRLSWLKRLQIRLRRLRLRSRPGERCT